MRFLINDIELKLQLAASSESYLQKITSEVFLNGKTTINSSEKTLSLEISRKKNQLPQINIKSKNHAIALAPLLKKQEAMTIKMATLTDSVILGIDANGDIDTIHNHHIIKQKWDILKKELAKQYEGDIMEIYCFGIDKKINDSKKLISDFKQARLFGLLWDNLYGDYTDDKSVIKKRTKRIDNCVNHIPIIINEDIFCNLIDDNNGIVELQIKGQLNKEETYIKKIENHFIREGAKKEARFALSKYNGLFQFDIKSGLLKKGSLLIETVFGEYYKKKDQFDIQNI